MSGLKKSYTIFCTSSFRDRVEWFAAEKNLTVGDMARSALVLVPQELFHSIEDPGEPDHKDREIVVLKSGKSKGRKLKRKPRLQLRLNGDYKAPTIRKALALAIKVHTGKINLNIYDSSLPSPADQMKILSEKAVRWQAIVGAVSFTPLANGVRSREDALYVLGFGPKERPSRQAIKEKFKMLAMIYHPDSPYAGSHKRMSQLNEAMTVIGQATYIA